MPQSRRRWHALRTGPSRTLSVRSRIVVAILVVAALGLAASGVASYLVQRKDALATVDAQLLHTVPSLKAIAADETTGAPVTSVGSVLRLAMQHVVPGANQSMLGFIDGKPALVPDVNLPFRIDKDSALVARMLSEANPTRVVIGTAESSLGTLRYLIIPVRE